MFQTGSAFQISGMNGISIIVIEIKKISSFMVRYLEIHLLFFDNGITFFFSAKVS